MLGIFWFVLGGMAGAIVGVFIMCIAQIHKVSKRQYFNSLHNKMGVYMVYLLISNAFCVKKIINFYYCICLNTI